MCSDSFEGRANEIAIVNFRPGFDIINSKRSIDPSFSQTGPLSDASTATSSSASSQQSELVIYNTGDPEEVCTFSSCTKKFTPEPCLVLCLDYVSV